MSNYQRGARREYAAKDQLSKLGYTVVRAAGSHGKADLVAWNDVLFRIIQIKSSKSGRMSKDAHDDLKALRKMRVPKNTTKELWVYTKGNTTPRVIRIKAQ